jgi:phosphoribosylanthranilate isomerase
MYAGNIVKLRTKIKICGLTDAETATAAAEAGADFLGMVFASSKRQVTPKQALLLVEAVRKLEKQPRVVGVFVNTPDAEVNRIAGDVGLDIIQLSGGESADYCLKIQRPILKVIHVAAETTIEKVIREMIGFSRIKGINFLLDTKLTGVYGGTGKIFDSQIAGKAAARFPVFIAGGLTPENVGKLVVEVNPLGVDVSGGVEVNGRKDTGRIKKFIEAVRASEISLFKPGR